MFTVSTGEHFPACLDACLADPPYPHLAYLSCCRQETWCRVWVCFHCKRKEMLVRYSCRLVEIVWRVVYIWTYSVIGRICLISRSVWLNLRCSICNECYLGNSRNYIPNDDVGGDFRVCHNLLSQHSSTRKTERVVAEGLRSLPFNP